MIQKRSKISSWLTRLEIADRRKTHFVSSFELIGAHSQLRNVFLRLNSISDEAVLLGSELIEVSIQGIQQFIAEMVVFASATCFGFLFEVFDFYRTCF